MPGWQNLEFILQSAGEKIVPRKKRKIEEKRPRSSGEGGGSSGGGRQEANGSGGAAAAINNRRHHSPPPRSGEPLTKRLAAVRLTDRNDPHAQQLPVYNRAKFEDL